MKRFLTPIIEATKAIAQQLQLRNLGGIIIIDFIDMKTDEHRNRVIESLEEALSKDRVKTNVNGFTQLGLVEMTRKTYSRKFRTRFV